MRNDLTGFKSWHNSKRGWRNFISAIFSTLGCAAATASLSFRIVQASESLLGGLWKNLCTVQHKS
ncbi:hypothetical protein BJX99DRAFT_217430 [Aspergillus californicus]